MICLRCGYCCVMYSVVIIKPEAIIDGEVNLNTDQSFCGKIEPGICPHLKDNGDRTYTCKIHNYEWYKETPCYSHTQIGQENDECRMGRYILDHPQLDFIQPYKNKKAKLEV